MKPNSEPGQNDGQNGDNKQPKRVRKTPSVKAADVALETQLIQLLQLDDEETRQLMQREQGKPLDECIRRALRLRHNALKNPSSVTVPGSLILALYEQYNQMENAITRGGPLLLLLSKTIFADRREEAVGDAIKAGKPDHEYMDSETMHEASCLEFIAYDVAALLYAQLEKLWSVVKEINALQNAQREAGKGGAR